jgi:hypothetical protein
MTKWQPIETAPENGAPILIGMWGSNFDGPEWITDIVYWKQKGELCSHCMQEASIETWANIDGSISLLDHNEYKCAWTHWMPLPEPPQ